MTAKHPAVRKEKDRPQSPGPARGGAALTLPLARLSAPKLQLRLGGRTGGRTGAAAGPATAADRVGCAATVAALVSTNSTLETVAADAADATVTATRPTVSAGVRLVVIFRSYRQTDSAP